MAAASWVMAKPSRLRGRRSGPGGSGGCSAADGRIRRLPPPLSGWTVARDAPAPPAQTFREWWRAREGGPR